MASAPDAAKTYGPLLLGGLVASFLSGITSLQAILYYRLYSEDAMKLKVLVTAVWGLDLLHTAFTWHGMWYYLVENFGDNSKIKLIHISIPCTGLITAFITVLVQFFYVQRIFRLSKRNYWISIPILLLSLARLLAAFVIVTNMFILKTFPAFARYDWLLTFALTLSSVVDIIITAAMFVLLKNSRQQSMSIHNVIDQLVLYSLEIGTLTSLGAILAMICWTAIPNKLIFLGSLYPVGKVYANSFLALVNARYQLRRNGGSRSSQFPPCRITGSRFLEAGRAKEDQSTELKSRAVEISVQKDVEFDDSKAAEGVPASNGSSDYSP